MMLSDHQPDRPLRVLLVEDDADDYVLTRDLLAEIDVEVELAWEPTYREAITTIREGDFDAILLDYRLGGDSGLDLLREIGDLSAETPVIMLTGQRDAEIDLEALRAGAADYLSKGDLDAQRLSRALRYAVERHRLVARARQISMRDELTGLYNRRGFLSMAEQQVHLARRKGEPLAILFIDLDGLKEINDEIGHQAGDDAIAAAAKLLLATFRRSDIVARFGGDEFVVLAPETDAAGVEVMEAHLRDRAAAFNASGELSFAVEFSLGSTIMDPASDITLDDLVASADEAMYEQKQKRRATSPAR